MVDIRNSGMVRSAVSGLKTQLGLAQLAIAHPSFPDEESVAGVESLLDNAKEMLLMIRALSGLPAAPQAGDGSWVRE